jgi:hypothetical protein
MPDDKNSIENKVTENETRDESKKDEIIIIDVSSQKPGDKSTQKPDPFQSTLPKLPFKYESVDKMLKETYIYKRTNFSAICDVLAMYIKGQKILYVEAKTICEQRLNYLMLPAIIITSVSTILSLVLKEYDFGATIISSLNGFNALLLALINYLKLDGRAESHRISAYKLSKIQSYIEFNSGKILFLDDKPEESLTKIINEVETQIREIRETNQFILPEIIRHNYPITYNTNVFAEIKRLQTTEMLLTEKLKNILNEHYTINIRYNSNSDYPTRDKDKEELNRLEEIKNATISSIIAMKDDYLAIDDMFDKELHIQINRPSNRYNICNCLKL